MGKEIDINREVKEAVQKEDVKINVKLQRDLVKKVAKELKINVLEVEYLVTEMGFCLIVGTMQGKQLAMMKIMSDKMNSDKRTRDIRDMINSDWEKGRKNNSKK